MVSPPPVRPPRLRTRSRRKQRSPKPGPVKRRDLLAGLQSAADMLREMGSQWHEIPGHLRYAMLRLADALDLLINRAR